MNMMMIEHQTLILTSSEAEIEDGFDDDFTVSRISPGLLRLQASLQAVMQHQFANMITNYLRHGHPH